MFNDHLRNGRKKEQGDAVLLYKEPKLQPASLLLEDFLLRHTMTSNMVRPEIPYIWDLSLPVFTLSVVIGSFVILGCLCCSCKKFFKHCFDKDDNNERSWIERRRFLIKNRPQTPMKDPRSRVRGRIIPDCRGRVDEDPRTRIDPCSRSRILVPELLMLPHPSTMALAVASGTVVINVEDYDD